MQIINTAKQTQQQVNEWRKAGYTIGFVPTMGFLHEGHKSLIDCSVAENDKTVVSIFVNPTQFAPTEDLEKYPKDFTADSTMCQNAGVDLIFFPQNEEMYPKNFATNITMNGDITKQLCGKSRPTHFSGVCTVVAKLFNIVPADNAYFGKKDAQQLAIITQMVQDLNFSVKIIGCPIIREIDGLAKSSRNSYLSADERKAAVIVSKAIFTGEKLAQENKLTVEQIVNEMHSIIESEPLAKIDYVEIVDLATLTKISQNTIAILGAVAVFIGKTRLIDNFILERK
ncbi:MAG: pantoate--beta-alanine ligase [Firmicutes bacterium]|nr:pantoate--beta-alanine ligase [Bacillota bacterium]